MSDFVVVQGTPVAKNLIYATWLRCYEASSLAAKNIPRDVFFGEHHKLLDSIFARGPEVRLAVLPDEPDVVLGWSVHEGGIVHFVYVKPAFRKHGVAAALLEGVQRPFVYTHWTHALRELHGKLAGCVYNPYLLTLAAA
jgi:GNAT superfamily N-acetyltransferase